MGKAGANRPLSAALTEGRPQMKTKTVRMAQGVQARITSARGCWVTARGAWASPPLFSWPLSEVERQMVLGCHMRRKPTVQTMETMAAMMSTSSGPMKLDTRYCGMAKDTPVTKMMGQISIMALRPAKAQISQNGTSTEKNGSWRPTMAVTSIRSYPWTLASVITGVPSAPKATGAVLAISDRPEAASGEKPRPMRMAAVTATGVPKPAAPSKKAPKAKAISSSWMRLSSVMPAMESCRILKLPFFSVSWCRKMMFRTIQPMGSSPVKPPNSAARPAMPAGML